MYTIKFKDASVFIIPFTRNHSYKTNFKFYSSSWNKYARRGTITPRAKPWPYFSSFHTFRCFETDLPFRREKGSYYYRSLLLYWGVAPEDTQSSNSLSTHSNSWHWQIDKEQLLYELSLLNQTRLFLTSEVPGSNFYSKAGYPGWATWLFTIPIH
jgi:hypothetical protein